MQLNPYLSFNGQCEAAFKFYQQCLGGEIVAMMTYAGSPMAEQTPPEWHNKILHARLVVGDKVLMGSDAPPDRYEAAERLLGDASASTTRPRRNASSAPCRKTGRCRCRSSRPSGPSALACSSINSAYRG